jgi:two-component system phosphate regulon sensor histidine kinase PhoR
LKDEFIAIVSHELRTPLSSVYGAAATLQQRQLDEEVRNSLLSIIYRESDRLARLVDDVLWVSRLESGRVETAIARCDATELATEAVHAAEAHLPDGFTLEFTCAPSLPPLAADGQKLRQVLANIIENAVKYSPDGGRIEVNVEQRNGSVVFAVRDEGLGIPADEQSRIFEKFHRLDPNLTRGVSGTGLGLYICRELIRQMNGTIAVSSAEGKGSTFTIELPSADGDDRAAHGDGTDMQVDPPLRTTLAEAFAPIPPGGDKDGSHRPLRVRVGGALSRALPNRTTASRR